VFAGLLFWGWTWGLAGLLLGVPLMMILKVVADRLPGLRWLSRLLSEEQDDADHVGIPPDAVLQSLRQRADSGMQMTRRDSVPIVDEESQPW